MNDKELFKKELELRDLALFLAEYERITGIETALVAKRERPDFEVYCGGRLFGLEATQSVEHPGEKFYRKLFGGPDGITISAASDAAQYAIYQKETKRKSTGWAHSESTILVVHLKTYSGREIFGYWDEQILEELRATGFVEIWLCDHGPEKPYRTVELVGVKPALWEGVHRHSMYGSKPYG